MWVAQEEDGPLVDPSLLALPIVRDHLQSFSRLTVQLIRLNQRIWMPVPQLQEVDLTVELVINQGQLESWEHLPLALSDF